jgi:hypothetical protein
VSNPLLGQAYNRYAYALNSPLAVTDPSGHQPVHGGDLFESAHGNPPPEPEPSPEPTPAPQQAPPPTPPPPKVDKQGPAPTTPPESAPPGNSPHSHPSNEHTISLSNPGGPTGGPSLTPQNINNFMKRAHDAVGGYLIGHAVGYMPGGVLFNMSGADKGFSRDYQIGKAVGEIVGGLMAIRDGLALAAVGVGGGAVTAVPSFGIGAAAGGAVALAGKAWAASGAAAVIHGGISLVNALNQPSSPPTGLQNTNNNQGSGGTTNNGMEAMSKAAAAPDRGGLTKAGRALAKHGGRQGSAFPQAKGNPQKINQDGQAIVDEILGNPGSTVTTRHHARYGNVTEVRHPDGRGIRYDSNGEFMGFLEP